MEMNTVKSWTVEPSSISRQTNNPLSYYIIEDGKIIGSTWINRDDDLEQRRARMMAAAPDMLLLLKRARTQIETIFPGNRVVDQINSLIEMLEGKRPDSGVERLSNVLLFEAIALSATDEEKKQIASRVSSWPLAGGAQ